MTGPAAEPDVRENTPPRFDSLSSMQEQHSSLVKEIGADILVPGNPDRIAEFIRRGVATGAILDAREDRTAAQSLINFWVSRLSSASSDARRASADGKLSAPPSSAPEIEDTLLGEFDPATIANATEKADRWLETLNDDERRLARGIMLRLVRLSAQGRTFDPVPATPLIEYDASR